MKYFQCGKCKALKQIADINFDSSITYTYKGEQRTASIIKPELSSELTCLKHGRRMRELTEEEYAIFS